MRSWPLPVQVIDAAASSWSEHLVLQGPPAALADRLRERGRVDVGPLRPADVLPIDFHALIRKVGRWSSKEREAVLQEALVTREFNATASPFLVSESLYSWLASCVATARQPSDSLYTHLVTLARWSINRALAASISDDIDPSGASHVVYAPAYARAKTLAENYLPAGAADAYFLRQELGVLYGEARSHRSDAEIPYSAAFPMPVLGAWVMLTLPPTATLPNYLAEIAQQRSAPEIEALRRWLSGHPTREEVGVLVGKVQRRLKVPRRSLSKMTVWAELSATRPPNVGVKAERELPSAGSLSMKQWLRSLRTGDTVALLTGCLEALLREASLANDLVIRAERLLAGTAQRSNRQRGLRPRA